MLGSLIAAVLSLNCHLDMRLRPRFKMPVIVWISLSCQCLSDCNTLQFLGLENSQNVGKIAKVVKYCKDRVNFFLNVF